MIAALAGLMAMRAPMRQPRWSSPPRARPTHAKATPCSTPPAVVAARKGRGVDQRRPVDSSSASVQEGSNGQGRVKCWRDWKRSTLPQPRSGARWHNTRERISGTGEGRAGRRQGELAARMICSANFVSGAAARPRRVSTVHAPAWQTSTPPSASPTRADACRDRLGGTDADPAP